MSKEGLFDKLEVLAARFEEIGTQLGDPSVIADQKRFRTLNKSYRDLEDVVVAWREYKVIFENIQQAREVLNNEKDEDFRIMAKGELEELEPKLEKLEEH